MYADTTVIYSDILFLINFSIDFLCLFITGRVLNRRMGTIKPVISSVIGGLYSFLPFLFTLPVYISLILNITVAAVMCLITYSFSKFSELAVNTLTFGITSALMGGIITAVFNLFSSYSNGTYAEMTTFSFVAVCVISALAVLGYGLICRKRINTRSAEIRIHSKGDRFTARLIADSGNLVTEPFSALPVIIISAASLPPPYDRPESELFPLPLRAIPFGTSAGKGCFFGFRPDKIELIRLGSKPKRIDAYIGIDTGNTRYSGYDGLIPTSLL